MSQNLEDFQFSGPQFIYQVMHSFKYGGYCPHTPVEMLIGVIFCHFLEIDMLSILLSILIATLDMHKGILPGTAKLKTTPNFLCLKGILDLFEQGRCLKQN